MKTSPQAIIALIRENRKNPRIKRIATGILRRRRIKSSNYPRIIQAIAEWVRQNVRFQREPKGEDILHEPLEVARFGQRGFDCEEFSVLAGSLLGALGIPIKVKVVSKTGNIWDHVYLLAGYPPKSPTKWVPVDPTIFPPAGRQIPYVKERVLPVEGKTVLGAPGINLLDLLEQIIAPHIEGALRMQLNPQSYSPLQGQVRRLGKVSDRPDVPYRVFLVPGDAINAFAVPGGATYIYQGLVDRFAEDVQCGVLGHEVAHIARRHCINMYIAQVGMDYVTDLIQGAKTRKLAEEVLELIRKGYSRKYEYEADKCSVRYNQKAELHPLGIKKFLEWLVSVEQEPAHPLARLVGEYTRTHPYASDRLQRITDLIIKLGITEIIEVPEAIKALGKVLLPVGVGVGVLATGILLTRD